MYKNNAKPVSIRNSVLACLADCPADNHALQLAQFLYGTLGAMQIPIMKNFLLQILTLILVVSSYGQESADHQPLLMTSDQNASWLENFQNLECDLQLKYIKGRYFTMNFSSPDNEGDGVAPLLIIDGIPIDATNLNENKRKLFLKKLTADKIKEIKVLDKEPEGLYINKAFTGVIMLVLNDKKLSRELLNTP